MGATRVVNVAKQSLKDVMADLHMEGFDVGLEMSGNPRAFNDMLDCMYHGGKIALLGILPQRRRHRLGQDHLQGPDPARHLRPAMYETWYKMTQMVLSGFPLHKVLTHQMHIDDFQKGFDLMEGGKSRQGGVELELTQRSRACGGGGCRCATIAGMTLPCRLFGGVHAAEVAHRQPPPATPDIRSHHVAHRTLCRHARRDPRRRPVQVRAHHHRPAVGRDRTRRRPHGAELLRQQLPRPGRPSGRHRRRRRPRSTRTASAWPPCASSAAPRTCTSNSSETIADFFGTEDTILYAACFDANGGLFEPLLDEHDAIISDALNHASIIDGVRLCKAKRYRYANCDMADLETQLQQAEGRRRAHDHDHHRRRVLDGRHHRAARPDHRAGGEVRRAGAHRRMPRHRLPRRHRPRLGRSEGRDGARSTSSPARSARRWAARSGGFTTAQEGSHRTAAPAFAPVPVLQLAAAARGRRRHQGLRDAVVRRRTARAPAREHRATSASAWSLPASTSSRACIRSAR